jgi:hypothetical protein
MFFAVISAQLDYSTCYCEHEGREDIVRTFSIEAIGRIHSEIREVHVLVGTIFQIRICLNVAPVGCIPDPILV